MSLASSALTSLSDLIPVVANEAHVLAGIISKNGFKVVKPPKSFRDFRALFSGSEREAYTDDGKLKFHFYNGSVTITDTTNALEIGKTCDEFHISWHGGPVLPSMITDMYDDKSFAEFLADVGKKDTSKIGRGVYFDFRSVPSKDVFSPFALSRLQRVDALPSKITTRHVMRLIANGQYDVLNSDFSYTDDYAFDNSNNHGKAANIPAMPVLIDMLRSKYNTPYFDSRAKAKGVDVISFGPHSNKSYSLVVNLKAKLSLKV